ncbi:hypothetical protein K402DRAFT_174025 [Aulographum hederae CBS 113979]|uniref:Uncharacterized protein n=1 Tax=Aulographum hederae CBS 113979 TaxID=1176131 RepID=A0A6G1HDV9_9PEZI|nr:hypothetical protein K402DRAFT_174025 [Aulographum hederae CBS 113979]
MVGVEFGTFLFPHPSRIARSRSFLHLCEFCFGLHRSHLETQMCIPASSLSFMFLNYALDLNVDCSPQISKPSSTTRAVSGYYCLFFSTSGTRASIIHHPSSIIHHPSSIIHHPSSIINHQPHHGFILTDGLSDMDTSGRFDEKELEMRKEEDDDEMLFSSQSQEYNPPPSSSPGQLRSRERLSSPSSELMGVGSRCEWLGADQEDMMVEEPLSLPGELPGCWFGDENRGTWVERGLGWEDHGDEENGEDELLFGSVEGLPLVTGMALEEDEGWDEEVLLEGSSESMLMDWDGDMDSGHGLGNEDNHELSNNRMKRTGSGLIAAENKSGREGRRADGKDQEKANEAMEENNPKKTDVSSRPDATLRKRSAAGSNQLPGMSERIKAIEKTAPSARDSFPNSR